MTYKRIPRRKSPRNPGSNESADTGSHDKRPADINNEGKPDEMQGFRPGPGNTGSVDGRDETGRKQVNHKI